MDGYRVEKVDPSEYQNLQFSSDSQGGNLYEKQLAMLLERRPDLAKMLKDNPNQKISKQDFLNLLRSENLLE